MRVALRYGKRSDYLYDGFYLPDKQQLRKRSLATEACHLSGEERKGKPVAREARRSLSATRVVGLKMRTCDDEFIDVCRRERALKQPPSWNGEGSSRNISIPRGREFRLARARDDDLFVIVQDYLVDSTLLNRIIHF